MGRNGNDDWFDIVKWTLFVVVNSKQLCVNANNFGQMKKSTNPDVKRLLGVMGDNSKDFGLAKGWRMVVINQVGNYGQGDFRR